MADTPCAACSWTPERQSHCSYTSHVKLFYEASNRGVWSIGSKLIVKEMSDSPRLHEVDNIQFVRDNTTIPVPEVVADWAENGRYFVVTKRVDGVTLKEAWPTLTAADKDSIAKQGADYLSQLRRLHSPKVQSLMDGPVLSASLFPGVYGTPHGPFASDAELWAAMEASATNMPEIARRHLQKRMPPAAPYTFTHPDLNTANIMVCDGRLTAIIDWESAAYFPVWWEAVACRVGEDDEDWQWKMLLRKHMDDEYAEAQEFWMDYYALAKYPNLDARGRKLLDELERECAQDPSLTSEPRRRSEAQA